MALTVCLALSPHPGAIIVPRLHGRKPRQGKEVQSLLLWWAVFLHYPYVCRAAQKLMFTLRSASAPLDTPRSICTTPRLTGALARTTAHICRHVQGTRVHVSSVHTYIHVHRGHTLLDSHLRVGKGVQIKEPKSSSCLLPAPSKHQLLLAGVYRAG